MTGPGHTLPRLMDTVIAKFDVMPLVGARENVERAVTALGYAERASVVTDLVMAAVGCLRGRLAGMMVVPAAGIPVTLGAGGGVLLAGLVCGWLRSVRPMFGRIPDAGQWLLNDPGFSLFVACVGLTSGKAAVDASQAAGSSGGVNLTASGASVSRSPPRTVTRRQDGHRPYSREPGDREASAGRETAVHANDLPADEVGRGRRQEQYQVRDLHRLAKPA